MLTDDAARAEFDQDPQGALDRAGLEGVTADDVRDARLQLADSGAVSATDDGEGSSYTRGDDPVREIHYTAQHYVADTDHSGHANSPDLNLVDDSTVLTIDDRDTFIQTFISDDDTTINAEDSFNTEIDAENSFNDDDVVTAVQDNDVVNEDNDVVVVDADGSDDDADDDADDPDGVLDQPI